MSATVSKYRWGRSSVCAMRVMSQTDEVIAQVDEGYVTNR
jgi:hypothetical protein